MRINVAVPEHRVDKPILDAALEATTRLNESLIEHGDVPTFDEVRHRIQWRPEPPGDEHFDHAGLVIARGWGDCDDQAPFAAASMRATGEDPGARAVVRRSGPKRWHAVVKLSDGSYRDPSKETGMRPGISPGVFGASVASLAGPSEVGGSYIALPRLAARPIRNPVTSDIEAWQARADLPWHWSPGDSPTDIAMASLHASPVASQAIVGALEGALDLAGCTGWVDGDTMAVGEAIQWVCGGADYEEVAREFGPEVADEAFIMVDGFFKKIGQGLAKIGKGVVKVVTSKLGRGLISMIPGVGPAAATALDVASGPLNKLVDKKPKKRPGGKVQIRKVDPFKNIKATKEAKLVAKLPPGVKMPPHLKRALAHKAQRRREEGRPSGALASVTSKPTVRRLHKRGGPPVRRKPQFNTSKFQKAMCYFPPG